jgi:RNA polymerase sigma-70 factor (ECF subfamily)
LVIQQPKFTTMTALNFQESIRTHNAPLTAYAISLTRDSNNAQDLLQETLMRALIYKEKFKEGTNLRGWLLTIMRNVFINDHRRKSRHRSLMETGGTNMWLDNFNEPARNGGEDNFVKEDLHNAISSLENEYKLPFLRHYEGFKYQEIAEELNLPLGTVKSRIFFARKRIRKYLKGIGFER